MKTKDDWTVEDSGESERQYRATLDALDDPLHVVDRDLHVILVNLALVEWLVALGIDHDILGKRITDAFDFLPEHVMEEYSQVFEKGETVRTTESTVIEGREIVTETLKMPIFKEGKTIQVITVIRDTTEREELLRKIKESERRYRSLFENTNDAVFLIDLNGRHIDANQLAADLLGYTKEELLDISVNDVVDASEIDDADQVQTKLLAREEVPIYERTFTKKDGSKLTVELNVALVRDVLGNPTHIQSIVRDVSTRKAAKEALERSEHRLRNLISNLPEGVAIVDVDEKFTFVNQRFCDLLGYSEDVLLQKTVFDITDETFSPNIREETKLRKTGKHSIYNLEMIRKDGERRIFRISGIPWYDDFGEIIGTLGVVSDVTDLVDLQDALQSSEMKHRMIFDSASDGIIIQSMTGQFLAANQVICNRLGYSRDEFLHMNPTDIDKTDNAILPKEGSVNIDMYQTIVFETEHLCRDGRVIPTEVSSRGILYEGQLAILSIARDITARVAAEQQLTKLSKAIEQSPASVVITDVEGQIEYVNPKFSQLTGYSLDEVIGENPRVLKTEFTPDETHVDLWDTITQGKEWHGEFANKKKNGEIYWEEAWIAPILGGSGEITHYVAVKLDITRVRQEQQALRESEERFRKFFENEPDYCYMVSPEGFILDANQAALERLGYSRAEMIGKPLQIIYAEESLPRVKELHNQWKETGELRDEELIIKTKTGERRIVLLSSSALRDKNGEIIHSLSTQKDITDIRTAQNEMERSYKDLELYASLLQHDLRSDLHIILGHAEATKMVAESGSVAETCSTIVEASSLRMVRLLDAFKRPTREEERDIVQLLEKIGGLAEVAHSGLKIHIKVKDKPEGKNVNAGRLLPMVFDNLFRNAYIYGSQSVEVLVTINFTKASVTIDVADDGPGIHVDLKNRLFEKGASTTGGGYGLYLSQKVIEGYGGTMELLSSSAKKGATFRIVLPLV